MEKKLLVISRISGELRALVKGKGWMALTKINPNDQVAVRAGGRLKWINFKTDLIKAKSRGEQYRLLAEGYAADLY